MAKAPFTRHGERAKYLLELIHTDVCGPMSINARGNYQYFITFTDDFSRYGYVYNISLNLLKSSKNFRMKYKISLTRK